MDFRFTDEQRMLADTAASFMQAVSDSTSTRAAMATDLGFDRPTWQRLCEEMYWQGIAVPEAQGGLALGMVELAIVLEAMGERLHCSPLYATAVATLLLRSFDSSPTRDALLEHIAGGSIVALAHSAAHGDWSVNGCAVHAVRKDEGWCLDGQARFVPFGHAADTVLVVATTDAGMALFAVQAGAEGVTCERTPTLDQTRAMAELQLASVHVAADQCVAADAAEDVSRILDAARILLAADQVGGARKSLEISVDYVKERVQFGRTVASFQAIKHKAADMMVKAESARSLLYAAACIADEWFAGEGSDEQLAEAAAMTAAAAGDAYFFCAGCGIQLHGGVGITEEYDIQLYFKRARSTEAYLGQPAQDRERVAQLLLDGA